MNIAIRYRDRVDAGLMLPQVNWREPKNERHTQMSMPAKSAGAETRTAHGGTTAEKVKKS
jgi:hypothetical protein